MSESNEGALAAALEAGHERVHLVQDPESGLRAMIAVHSTVLGPALGGLRISAYEDGIAGALDDALRLSRAMTLKASAAGLDLGGGKAVIVDDGRPEMRRARLAALAHEIDDLEGTYITAEDVGTTPADMDFIADHTPHVVGTTVAEGVGGDPSPDTARTVLGAMRAAARALFGAESLAGRSVAIVGLGKVGGRLAAWLLEEGATVIGYDPDPIARESLRARGMQVASSTRELLAAEVDILAPCALGGLIDEEAAAQLRCRIVCGAANNPLTGRAACEVLRGRGILYVPDFMANCGGLIHVDLERRHVADTTELEGALSAARERIDAVIEEAVGEGRSPATVAEEHAGARILGSARAEGLVV